MILREINALFLHAPKTGGNSIHVALQHYDTDGHIIRKHSPVASHGGVQSRDGDKHHTCRQWLNVLGPKRFDNLFKFVVVRNPWDRLVSWCAFCRSATSESWLDRRTPDPTAADKLDKLDVAVLKDMESEFAAQSLVHYVSLGNRPLVDQILRFESLDDDFARLCAERGWQARLPHINKSGRRRRYRTYYDDNPQARAWVERVFAPDIAAFDYEY